MTESNKVLCTSYEEIKRLNALADAPVFTVNKDKTTFRVISNTRLKKLLERLEEAHG